MNVDGQTVNVLAPEALKERPHNEEEVFVGIANFRVKMVNHLHHLIDIKVLHASLLATIALHALSQILSVVGRLWGR